MPDEASLEARVAKLEREMAELKRQYALPQSESKNWVDDVCGSMKDVPDWEEIVKEGREIAEGRKPMV